MTLRGATARGWWWVPSLFLGGAAVLITRQVQSYVMRVTYRELCLLVVFFFQAEDGIRDYKVTGVQTCALPICVRPIRNRRQRRPPWAERRLSELAGGRSESGEHRALLRCDQLRFAHQGSGARRDRIHRPSLTAGGHLDGAQPNPGGKRGATDDRIGAQQPDAGEGTRLGRAINRGARHSVKGREIHA